MRERKDRPWLAAAIRGFLLKGHSYYYDQRSLRSVPNFSFCSTHHLLNTPKKVWKAQNLRSLHTHTIILMIKKCRYQLVDKMQNHNKSLILKIKLKYFPNNFSTRFLTHVHVLLTNDSIKELSLVTFQSLRKH